MNETVTETEIDPQETADIEAKARRMGWKPPEEYDNRGKFMTAAEFVQKGEEDLPLLKARLQKMDSNYNKVLTELADTRQVLSDFREFATRGEQRAYERARRELIEKRDAAVAHADTETFTSTNAEIERLDRQAAEDGEKARQAAAREKTVEEIKQNAQQTQQQTQQVDPVAEQWVKDNPWFLRDTQLNRIAKALDTELLNSAPGLPVDERLATVKAEVIRMFPDKFKNPLRDQPTNVATPGGGGRKKEGKSYEDLPPEAKKACDRFMRTIPGYKVEDYIKDYDWS